eukprot:1020680-Amphidinium_carterae.1
MATVDMVQPPRKYSPERKDGAKQFCIRVSSGRVKPQIATLVARERSVFAQLSVELMRATIAQRARTGEELDTFVNGFAITMLCMSLRWNRRQQPREWKTDGSEANGLETPKELVPLIRSRAGSKVNREPLIPVGKPRATGSADINT